MNVHIHTLASLATYFAIMLAIGVYAFRQSANSSHDYLLGGRKLGPAVTALSVGASDMSGWILMGLPGAVYVSGLGNIWIAIGLTLGALLNYQWVAPKLRIMTEALNDAITLPDYFAQRFPSHGQLLKMVSATVIIIFFTIYSASGMVAGGKLAEAAFGLPYSVGVIATVTVILAYTLLGGFLAVSLTDFVQGCIMLATFILLPVIAMSSLGGPVDSISLLADQTQHLFSWQNITPLALMSSLAWGLGYFGQPHILVRFMAIEHVDKLKSAQRIGMSWMILSLTGTILIGLLGILIVQQTDLPLTDPETIVIVLSQHLLSPAVAGVCLAAILAAIMSTISSQLLVTASALSEDLVISFSKKAIPNKVAVSISRLGVIAVAIVATIIAMDDTSGVLKLVQHAWAGFGAAFGPLIIASLYYQRMTSLAAISSVIVGAATVIIWEYVPIFIGEKPLSNIVYSMIPGFLMSSITIILVSELIKIKRRKGI